MSVFILKKYVLFNKISVIYNVVLFSGDSTMILLFFFKFFSLLRLLQSVDYSFRVIQ